MEHVFADSRAPFVGTNGTRYALVPLTRQYATQHLEDLARIHSLIPYIGDDPSSAFEATDETMVSRWHLSFAVECAGAPIAFLIATPRGYSARHPFRAAYIHRMAVREDHQGNQVGAQLVLMAIKLIFDAIPSLLTFTVQTNDERVNEPVISFYESLGFKRAYRVQYPSKTDVLLDLERDATTPRVASLMQLNGRAKFDGLRPKGKLPDPWSMRVTESAFPIWFGSTSKQKLDQYRFLFRAHGLRLYKLQQVIDLVEPQVEATRQNSESELVEAPLKLFSRFAATLQTYPVVVEDTMLFIEHFHENYDALAVLPGPDTKRWWQALGAQGVCRIMKSSRRRRAKYVCQIGVNWAPKEYANFRYEICGEIASKPQRDRQSERNFPYTNATFFHSIFVPEGANRTLASMDANEFFEYDYRRRCVQEAAPFLLALPTSSMQTPLFDTA
ncbi:MAG TPA: non-canonical purine NTP pyrophosphatase [Fimbriimonas sp.]|nr:non-canonical purine NTP pyrophosphatase [Fimbriimonas sp.]